MQILRQRNRLRVAKNLDAFFGLVQDHSAVFAVREVALELQLGGRFKLPVDIVRYLANDGFAIQADALTIAATTIRSYLRCGPMIVPRSLLSTETFQFLPFPSFLWCGHLLPASLAADGLAAPWVNAGANQGRDP